MALTLAQQTARLARDVDEAHAHPERYFRVSTPSYNRLIEENTLSETPANTPTVLAAREITRTLRGIWPTPIRLSVRDIGIKPGVQFALRVPSTPGQVSGEWLDSYLTRYLGRPVASIGRRTIRRRDCGRDTELTLRVGRPFVETS